MRSEGTRVGRGRRGPGAGVAMLALALAGLLAAWLPASAHAQPVAHVSAPPVLCPAGAQLRASQPYTPPTQFSHVIHVPGDKSTIQAGVNAAQPGDLVLVAPGVYHENVVVCTPNITIRGEDRNQTILDGTGLTKHSNGFTVLADNVIIENMTAHHYSGNGFFWEYQTGYRGSYLTAYDNGDYGIYAFGSRLGEFDDSYASGSPDSGFYIGQCYPCDAIITRVKSEWNGLGYSGTNAGGNLTLENSEWDFNQGGIIPNTLDTERGAPERGTAVIGNYVHDNGNPNAPSNHTTHPALGDGIAVPGGNFNYIANNRVVNNSAYGILVIGNVDENFWLASGNVVTGNKVKGSGVADLALGAPSGANNCFSNNQAGTTLPALLEVTHACGSPWALNGGGDLSVTLQPLAVFVNSSGPSYSTVDYNAIPAPPAQSNMPDASTAPPGPIFTDPIAIDDTPQGALPHAVPRGGSNMLLPLGFTSYSIVQILLSLYGNLVLFALYAAWLAVAFVELAQRTDLSGGGRLRWGTLVVAVPLIGPIMYYFASGSKLSRGFRLGLVVGAPVLSLVLTVLLLVVAYFTL